MSPPFSQSVSQSVSHLAHPEPAPSAARRCAPAVPRRQSAHGSRDAYACVHVRVRVRVDEDVVRLHVEGDGRDVAWPWSRVRGALYGYGYDEGVSPGPDLGLGPDEASATYAPPGSYSARFVGLHGRAESEYHAP